MIRLLAMLVVMFALQATPAWTQAVTVEGNRYPETVPVAGKVLKLLGAGLRENWFVNAYTMGAYSESGICDAEALISADEIKYIRIDMLRGLSADRMSDALRKAFGRNKPADASADLNAHIHDFLSYFQQDLAQGANLELTYVPGVGTTLELNGKRPGEVLAGKDFADLLWSCYFSPRTCCPGLKARILAHCTK